MLTRMSEGKRVSGLLIECSVYVFYKILINGQSSYYNNITRISCRDMEVALNKIVPASWTRDGTFLHTMEGDDDMPGHVKSSMMGVSLNIPIRDGRLALGTWQGIYLNEHRDQGGWGGGHTRRIIITLQGQS